VDKAASLFRSGQAQTLSEKTSQQRCQNRLALFLPLELE